MLNNGKDSRTGYIVAEKTFKDLHELTKNSVRHRYDKEPIYTIEIDRSNLSEEQKELQRKNSYRTSNEYGVRIYEDTIRRFVKKVIDDEMYGGTKENFTQTVFDKVYNTNIKIMLLIDKDARPSYRLADVDVRIDGYEYENKIAIAESRDLKELKNILEGIKYGVSYYSDPEEEFVWLEKVVVGTYVYQFNEIDKDIKRYINRIIKEDYTYCLRNDKVIIPQEYLDKGQSGVKEWRDSKSSSNKNNSMEKRMLKEIVHQNKQYAIDTLRQVMHGACSGQFTWSIPSLCIDGAYNKTRTQKLMTQIFNADGKRDFASITKEEIEKGVKEYWKNKVMEIYNTIDTIKIEERK